MTRVVVTGLGTVAPVGNDTETFWAALIAGRTGIGQITRFDTEGFPVTIAGEVKDWKPETFLDRKQLRHTDLFVQFGLGASIEAVHASGLQENGVDADRVGVILGSGVGGIGTLEKQHSNLVHKGPSRISPFFIPMMIADMAAAAGAHRKEPA